MAKPREAGFTVLELIVSLLIVSLAVAIAAHLMAEAQRRSVIEQRRALEAAVPIALEQLRADVSAAAGGSGSSQKGEPLRLVLPSGLVIFYEKSGDQIIRRISEPAGQRVLLDGVTKLSWGWVGGAGIPLGGRPLLAIEVEYLRTRATGPLVAGGVRVTAPQGVERQTFWVMMRGGGGDGW